MNLRDRRCHPKTTRKRLLPSRPSLLRRRLPLVPKKKKEYVWSDDEVELLLNVTLYYKVAQAAESVDWESVKFKYKDIMQLYVDALPTDDSQVFDKNYPHKKEQVELKAITSKLKAIRLKFRHAVDSGRRSGHGRVVMIYYELCESVWGGSPATTQIDNGIESSEIISQDDLASQVAPVSQVLPASQDDVNPDSQIDPASQADDPASQAEVDPIALQNEPTSECTSSSGSTTPEESSEEETRNKESSSDGSVYTKRRQILEKKLKDYKQENLKRKLPVDGQLLGCAQEELALKKRLVEQVDMMNEKFADNMDRMTKNMDKLTDSVADGFSFLRTMMCQQPNAIYHPPYSSPYMQGSSRMQSFSPLHKSFCVFFFRIP